jgi:signal transduction histidine kinase
MLCLALNSCLNSEPAFCQNKLRVDIRDAGIGISAKEIAFIFDARYQATNSATDNCLHAGFGLAISRKLMALLDSDLSVQSQLGKGSCFSFELKMLK